MIAELTSFLGSPDACPQLGNKPCPHSRESHSVDSSVFDTFLHLLIVHSGSLQRVFDEAQLRCLASKDKNKVANDKYCRGGRTSYRQDHEGGEGTPMPLSPRTTDPKPSGCSSLIHVPLSAALGTRTLPEFLLCVEPSGWVISSLPCFSEVIIHHTFKAHLFLESTHICHCSLLLLVARPPSSLVFRSPQWSHPSLADTNPLMALSDPSKLLSLSQWSARRTRNQLLPPSPASPLSTSPIALL